uniref:Pentatricopeptide repeat-containing family protein n=1 Tax=Populus alba TaxID=43335 RepID=A0A4U5QBC3_POPAL|nr:pentatricopeptide repeat-containing family protein [Populus alba]
MFTFPAVLKSCEKFMGVDEGRQVHRLIVKMDFVCDIYVENSLVHFYSVCGSLDDASRVFDEMLVRDAVSWTGVISGNVSAGLFDKAVGLFSRMDVEPNAATFVSNALMDMYVKCESFPEAKQVFDELPEKDIVSWTSIICGMVQCKFPKEALELSCDVQSSGIEPDGIILTSVLSACASLGALDYGRWVHESIDHKVIKWDIQIGTAMVDMYAKCGCIEMAMQIFNGMPHKNALTWNAMLNGLAMHGHGQKALQLFEEMVREGMRPNEVTFLVTLTACCHCGLVGEGRRAGLLDEALELTKAMPMLPDVRIMGALLSACKANGNVELPQEILDRLVEFDSHDSGVYVLLSNIHAINQRWADVTRIRRLMMKKGIEKTPGSSVIEVDGKAHEFIVGDTRHPQDKHIRLF